MSEHPEVKEVFLDWTERAVERSSDYESQKKDYSGKKKKHTLKNIIATSENKIILWVSETKGGKNHDYALLKKSWFMEVLLWYVIWVDLWFQGIEKDFPHHNVNIPKKNYKSKPLTEEEKENNYLIWSIRVAVENVIWRAKKYWIVTNRYRSRTRWDFKTVKNNRKHKVMLTVCWLYNFWKMQTIS